MIDTMFIDNTTTYPISQEIHVRFRKGEFAETLIDVWFEYRHGKLNLCHPREELVDCIGQPITDSELSLMQMLTLHHMASAMHREEETKKQKQLKNLQSFAFEVDPPAPNE